MIVSIKVSYSVGLLKPTARITHTFLPVLEDFLNMATGEWITRILHFFNKTPIDWYSKKQSTVETATYGSEFVAARTTTEQIMDPRQTLRYLSANVNEVTYMFGDNESVVKSSIIPHAKLHKRHVLLYPSTEYAKPSLAEC